MKKFLVLVVFIALSVWTVSADQSDWLFCLIRKDQVTISLKQTTWYYKCSDTIVSLDLLIVSTAKDLMKIQTYITRGRDLEYRRTLKVDKETLLDFLQIARKNIVTNMETFESNLLQKSVQYFIIQITPYKIRLQKSLVKIGVLTLSWYATPALNSYAKLLTAQVGVIDKLSAATTKVELVDLLAKYVYLKKEIEWK